MIIPAHNEAGVIEATLSSLLDGAEPGEFAIYVVCNGCADNTAELARRFAGVGVVEVSAASKSGALNEGDRRAGEVFPRIYLDADVVTSAESLRRVVDALDGPDARAAAPRLVVKTEGRPLIVRGFYHVFVRLPWVTKNLVGSGFYALSCAGRRRFESFPELINDDQMVRSLFSDDERISIRDAVFTVEAPWSTLSLIRAKARVITGVTELGARERAAAPDLRKKRGGSLPLLRLMLDPRNWLPLCSYAFVRISARVIMYGWRFRGQGPEWNQDRTTRTI